MIPPQTLVEFADSLGLPVKVERDADHGDGPPGLLLTVGRTTAAIDEHDPEQRDALRALRDVLDGLLVTGPTPEPVPVPGRGRAVEAAPVYGLLSTDDSTRRVLPGFGVRHTEVEASANGMWIMRGDAHVWITESDVGAFTATVEAAEQDHYRLAAVERA